MQLDYELQANRSIPNDSDIELVKA